MKSYETNKSHNFESSVTLDDRKGIWVYGNWNHWSDLTSCLVLNVSVKENTEYIV